jgi:hypothetical protein
MPRINFVSFTFLFAFGLGSFVGIAMALLAVALARPEDDATALEQEPAAVVASPTETSSTPTPAPTGTATPEPMPQTTTALQVRIGPATGYAILGTLAGGSEVNLQGRDDTGDWLAIEFPPGSAARGWIPADDVDGLSVVQRIGLDVLQASLVETTPRFPVATSTPTLLEGNDGLPAVEETPSPTPDASETPRASSTPQPSSTPTPRPSGYGPTDLALGALSVDSDGRITVVVQNQGPGNVPGFVVQVSASGFAPELLESSPLLADDGAVLRTSAIQLTERTDVSVVIDPGQVLADVARGNNARSQSLAP